LQTIATETAGTYYNVENANQLSDVFNKIYLLNQQDRHLVGPRVGVEQDSTLYAVLRVLFLTAIGTLIGLSLGIIFDNTYLARSFSIGGGVAGFFAGFIL